MVHCNSEIVKTLNIVIHCQAQTKYLLKVQFQNVEFRQHVTPIYLWRFWLADSECLPEVLVHGIVGLTLSLGRLNPRYAALMFLLVVFSFKVVDATPLWFGIQSEATQTALPKSLQLLVELIGLWRSRVTHNRVANIVFVMVMTFSAQCTVIVILSYPGV